MADEHQQRRRRGALLKLGMPWTGLYYDRAGNPVASLTDFLGMRPFIDDCRVALDAVGDVEISTVWLGIDHSYQAGVGRPLIFETMIFGGTHDGEQRRYATEEEALAGHVETVERIRSETA